MESINTRYMYNLYGKQIVLLIILVFVGFGAQAQLASSKGNFNYFDFQKKPFYFGITLGTNISGYGVDQSKFFIANDSIRTAESGMEPGFNVHIIANMKIGEYFDFRMLPGFSGTVRNLEFVSKIDTLPRQTSKIESYFFELPLQLRYKSAPYKDKRAFVVAGIKYSYDVASNSNSRQKESLIKISPHDFQLEVGAGMQFFFPYFIFSPEIKFSRGLGNVLIYNDNLHKSLIIEQLNSQAITISFHFEG